MGISDFVQNIYEINTFPISFRTRGSNANIISDFDTPSSGNRKIRWEQSRKTTILELEEERIQAMTALEQK